MGEIYVPLERVVPLDHEDSNHKLVMDVLFSKVNIPSENIHHIDPSLLDNIEELVDSYESQLILEFASKDSARFPVFDLILIGIGPDGHTASLFPDHPLLAEEERWVAWLNDSPKPPPTILLSLVDLPLISTDCRPLAWMKDFVYAPHLPILSRHLLTAL